VNAEEIKKVGAAMAPFVNLDASLDDLKKRLPLAEREIKSVQKTYAKDKNMSAALKELMTATKAFSKLVSAAKKDAGDITDLCKDRALATTELPELKKAVVGKLPSIKSAADTGAEFWAACQNAKKAGKDAEPKFWGDDLVSMTVSVEYYNRLRARFDELKINLGTLK
jgi:chromosome segregation ATPase